VSADYFRALGIPLRKGRVLTRADRNGHPPVAVINETAARRFWPGDDPIGKHVTFGSSTGFTDPAHPVEIVGVVADVKYGSADSSVNPDFYPDFYTSYLQFAYPDTMVMVKARGLAQGLVPSLRVAVASVDSALPIFDVMMLDDRIDDAVARPRFNASAAVLFAAAALLLAALGVYGVLSYSVSARVREMGVRLALGADPARLVRLIVKDGVRLGLVGTSAGLVAAIGAGRVIRGLLVGIAASDPRLLATAAGVMIAAAIIAAAVPARRAARVDPLIALRSE
jgi:putative ABC transport system permease protein